ncbi:MAG: Hpt domain-containing protein [Lentisphaerae bacterium]|nr:Hpt domain-containing protein [Lentisphaerota bacterium]MCP4100683.1 Hpt domain-containing protein [Lentisphaerota bacterium]
MSDTKEFIFDYMRKNLGLSEVDIEDIFKTFLECAEEYIVQAKSQLASEDWSALTRLGHTIKGAAANIGANHLSLTGKELQEAANSKSTELIKEKISRLETILEGLR